MFPSSCVEVSIRREGEEVFVLREFVGSRSHAGGSDSCFGSQSVGYVESGCCTRTLADMDVSE